MYLAVQAFIADRCCRHASLYFVNVNVDLPNGDFPWQVAVLTALLASLAVRSLVTRWKRQCRQVQAATQM